MTTTRSMFHQSHVTEVVQDTQRTNSDHSGRYNWHRQVHSRYRQQAHRVNVRQLRLLLSFIHQSETSRDMGQHRTEVQEPPTRTHLMASQALFYGPSHVSDAQSSKSGAYKMYVTPSTTAATATATYRMDQ